MATKTLTKEQWATVKTQLGHPWGRAGLMIDGYRITLEVRRVSATAIRYEIAVFVNGSIKGEYLMNDCEERRRFYRPIVKKYHSKKERESLLKIGRKTLQRWAKENKLFDPDATYTIYGPSWGTFDPLRRHLEANNDSIELLGEQP